jgi:hypothetical protein
MGKIIDVDEVQRELNRAARDAKRGPADVRAGRFVHANARGDRTARANAPGTAPHPSKAGPQRNSKPVR